MDFSIRFKLGSFQPGRVNVSNSVMPDFPSLTWQVDGAPQTARWRSEAGLAAPRRITLADDTLPADEAWRQACEGTGLLWQGDFQNARHLLEAVKRRIERKPRSGSKKAREKSQPVESSLTPAETFHRHRLSQSQRARTLAMVLIPINGDYQIPLRRAPDLRDAMTEAWGPADGMPCVVALRELLGLLGAHEWRKKGVTIPALGDDPQQNRIHPWYGVFSPLRGEYIDLVTQARLPARDLAFDIGTGTGVLAAVLAKRGVMRVVATELDDRAAACARENVTRLGFSQRIEVVQTDMWPAGQAPLVVCNPPWLPARPSSPMERAIYDEGSVMLRTFLSGLPAHLTRGGEGWLLLSDLAEHLQLRSREELLTWIAEAGLVVLGEHQTRPRHGKAADTSDPLYGARAAEITSLWRLTHAR